MKVCDLHADDMGKWKTADYQVTVRRLSDDAIVTLDVCYDCIHDARQPMPVYHLTHMLGEPTRRV